MRRYELEENSRSGLIEEYEDPQGRWLKYEALEGVLADIEEMTHYLEEHDLGGDEVKRVRAFLGPRQETK